MVGDPSLTETPASGNSATHDAAAQSPRSANELNGLIHLYRAEVGRLTAFRTRLDTTTSSTSTCVRRSWPTSSGLLVLRLAPGQRQPLDQRDQHEQQDAHERRVEHRGVQPRGLELGR